MPDLSFQIEGAEPHSYAETPSLILKLRISNRLADEQVHSVMLRCQIMIDAVRRHYTEREKARLLDLFGEPDQWSRSLRSTLWTNVNVIVSSFSRETTVDVLVSCTFDFNVAATKYFAGLESGDVPLNLLFSGTVFYQGEGGGLQVSQIPWDQEASYRLPVSVWKEMMDIYYPNTAWLCLRRDIFDRLYEHKVRHGIPTWEQTLESVLPAVEKSTDGASTAKGPDDQETVH